MTLPTHEEIKQQYKKWQRTLDCSKNPEAGVTVTTMREDLPVVGKRLITLTAITDNYGYVGIGMAIHNHETDGYRADIGWLLSRARAYADLAGRMKEVADVAIREAAEGRAALDNLCAGSSATGTLIDLGHVGHHSQKKAIRSLVRLRKALESGAVVFCPHCRKYFGSQHILNVCNSPKEFQEEYHCPHCFMFTDKETMKGELELIFQIKGVEHPYSDNCDCPACCKGEDDALFEEPDGRQCETCGEYSEACVCVCAVEERDDQPPVERGEKLVTELEPILSDDYKEEDEQLPDATDVSEVILERGVY
jgi:hypothetical protein